MIASLLSILIGMSCRGTEGEAERLYIAALSAYSEENLDTAVELSQAAVKADSSFYQAQFLEAKMLFFLGNLEKALVNFEKLIKTYPEYTDARIWRIRTHLLLKNYTTAEKLLDRELSFNQADWRLYYLYSLLGLHTKDYSLQFSMAKRAELALKDSGKVFMDLAYLLYVSEMEERAEDYVEKARSVSDSNSSLESIFGDFELVFEGGAEHEQ